MPDVILTFGGGLNVRRRVADINQDECVSPSVNFDLDPQHKALNRRKPFDLVATAPNGGRINGICQQTACDCSVSTLIQAGGTVYSWDGDQSFTEVGTVSTAARLRGAREQNFTLEEYVVITDLAKVETVKRWDATTFSDLSHDLGGDLVAKYARTHDERVWLANVATSIAPGGTRTDTPHIILVSKQGTGDIYSDSDRPSTSLGGDAPFFLPIQDFRPINGLEEAFGQFIFSTARGKLYILTGASSVDYAIDEFYQGSAVVGDEAIKNIGNDVVLGLAGRIETLSGTLNFGDVETDDVSRLISPLVENTTSWTIEYDRRLQKIFCFPDNQSAAYVLHKNMLNDPDTVELSPWSKWTTAHPVDFNPTTVAAIIDPLTNRDSVFFGDSGGGIYRMDGSGDQDGGTDNVVVLRRSGLFELPVSDSFDFTGWINYRTLFETTVTITLLHGGTAVFTQEITKTLPDNPDVGVYNGPHYYGDQKTTYGFEFSGRVKRQNWAAAGQGSNFQLEVQVSTTADFDIEEIGVTFETKKE